MSRPEEGKLVWVREESDRKKTPRGKGPLAPREGKTSERRWRRQVLEIRRGRKQVSLLGQLYIHKGDAKKTSSTSCSGIQGENLRKMTPKRLYEGILRLLTSLRWCATVVEKGKKKKKAEAKRGYEEDRKPAKVTTSLSSIRKRGKKSRQLRDQSKEEVVRADAKSTR